MDRNSLNRKTAKTRSEIMRAVRSQDNKSTEVLLSRLLKEIGRRHWVSHSSDILGRPDFAFKRKKIAIFVDGCFWHGCKKCFRRPKTSQEYWDEKIGKNKLRDKKVTRELRRQGWEVIRVWEHQLKAPPRVKKRLAKKLS